MTAVSAYELRPHGTRVKLRGRSDADGGARWNCGGRVRKGGGGENVRRNADGGPIGPIIQLRVNNVDALDEVRGELKGSERIEKQGRIGELGNVLGIDAVEFRAKIEITLCDVEGRRIAGSGMGH